jgi:hypothetical protein
LLNIGLKFSVAPGTNTIEAPEKIEALDPALRAELEAFCEMRRANLKELYEMANRVAR